FPATAETPAGARAALTASGLNGMMPPREGSPMERRGSRLSRRQFVAGAAGLGLLAGCGRLPWPGQPAPRKVPTIGWLDQLSGESTDSLEPAPDENLEAFRQ